MVGATAARSSVVSLAEVERAMRTRTASPLSYSTSPFRATSTRGCASSTVSAHRSRRPRAHVPGRYAHPSRRGASAPKCWPTKKPIGSASGCASALPARRSPSCAPTPKRFDGRAAPFGFAPARSHPRADRGRRCAHRWHRQQAHARTDRRLARRRAEPAATSVARVRGSCARCARPTLRAVHAEGLPDPSWTPRALSSRWRDPAACAAPTPCGAWCARRDSSVDRPDLSAVRRARRRRPRGDSARCPASFTSRSIGSSRTPARSPTWASRPCCCSAAAHQGLGRARKPGRRTASSSRRCARCAARRRRSC